MGSSLYLYMITRLLSLLSFFHLIMSAGSPSPAAIRPLCHDDESSALSQFNQSFVTHYWYASGDPSAYPKTASWKLGDNSNCCSWDGVECDDDTGHVIGLDLSSSFLYGSINSTSSLFRLVHLQKLNLAYNLFNYSQIPSRVGHLSRLTYLNLSQSQFFGQIPSKISELSKLTTLDLSGNVGLKLEKPGLKGLLGNLTDLKEVHLSDVNISSAVPADILANFSSLSSLLLRRCRLRGEFPTRIFQLPNLQVLDVRSNPYLTGNLPKFNKSSLLKILLLAETGFSGELPYSMGNLNSLNVLDVNGCNFYGCIPSSLGNLTQLTTLILQSNNFHTFSRGTFALLGKQAKLTHLNLAGNNFTGEIPSLGNQTLLVELHLHSNQFTGQIPSWLANLTQLTELFLSINKLHGQIPLSILHRLVNLERLSLHRNNLSGSLEFDMFHNLKSLFYLRLGYNNLSLLLTNSSTTNANLPKFKVLELSACNLSEFPDFLRHQDEMEILVLQENKIRGQIPKWMWNMGKETLLILVLSDNFLTGYDQPPVVLSWASLQVLNLASNMIQGPLLIPPVTTLHYSVSKNSLMGEISLLICNLTSLYILDLSNNNLSGTLPQCLGNFSKSLSQLNLRNNNFHGTIPQTYTNRSKLRMIDLSQNQLQGSIPRSLANCKMLEILNLGNNQINDIFPSWLGTLPKLRILIIRSNEFHGAIWSPQTRFEFPMLHIIDLFVNGFTGKLPSEYFKNWNAMKNVSVDPYLTYLGVHMSFVDPYFIDLLGVDIFHMPGHPWITNFNYTMTITNKGIKTIYAQIPKFFIAMDLSSNRFEGDIPNSIGNLKGLQLLNLSNNILTGFIPSCLGNLTKLESLDLSQNKLSGEIPQQLTELTFLAFLNVSHNHLTGLIPRGKQFDTFQNSSFEGNSELCGNPLSKKCEHSEALSPPPLSSEQGRDSRFPSGYDWIFIVMGYGSGLVVGSVIGHTITTRNHQWFVETFGRRPQKRQRENKRGRGIRNRN